MSHNLFDSLVHPEGGGLPSRVTFEDVFCDGEEAPCQARDSWVSVEEIEGGISPYTEDDIQIQWPDRDLYFPSEKEAQTEERYWFDLMEPDPIMAGLDFDDQDGWLPRGSGPRKGRFRICTLGID